MLYDSVYLLRKRVCYPSRSRQFGAGLWEVARGAIPVTYSTLGVWLNLLGVRPNYLSIAHARSLLAYRLTKNFM